jgi:hypothetical protein
MIDCSADCLRCFLYPRRVESAMAPTFVGDKIDEKALKALIRAAVATEYVGAGYRSPRPLSEETKDRLRSVVKPALSVGALARPEQKNSYSSMRILALGE